MTALVGRITDYDFEKIGLGVNIHPTTIIQSPQRVSFADHIRIDANCFISACGGVTIGSHVHIANGTTIHGAGGVRIADFVGISMHCILLSQSDDFSGESLVGPLFKMKYKPGFNGPGPLILDKFAVIGARSTIMPGVHLKEGVVIGAHSLVLETPEKEWSIYAGSPAQYLGPRKRDMIELSELFLREFRDRGRIEL